MSAAPRGEFRVVFVVTQSTEAMQRLTGNAHTVWLHLKLTLPAHGIGLLYLEQLVDVCGTDATEDTVRAGLAELEAAGLLARERSVYWLLDALRDEPFMAVSSAQTRRGVQKKVATLPPLGIVAAFRAHYAAWFVDDPFVEPPTGATDTPGETPTGGGIAGPLAGAPATASVPVPEREGESETKVRVPMARVLAREPALQQWIDAEPARADERPRRRSVLKAVFARILRAGGSLTAVDAHAALIAAYLNGLHGTVDGEQLLLNLTDWLVKRDGEGRETPPLDTRVFRRFLAGSDSGQRGTYHRRSHPAPTTPGPNGTSPLKRR